MVLLLLDSDILIDMINENSEEENLNRIQNLIDANEIELLVPSILMKEWGRTKLETLRNNESLFKKASAISGNADLNKQREQEISDMKEKIGRIERMLNDGVKIKLTKGVKTFVMDRSIEGLAPFHHPKKNAINDALIYFSTTDFLRKKKITEFVFISRNRTEFSDLQEPTKLHPDLVVDSLETTYYISLRGALKALTDTGRFSAGKIMNADESPYGISVVRRRNKNFLEYLHAVLMECQRKMRFIPSEIFARIHPFRISSFQNNYSYYKNYVLLTNNPEVEIFFQNIDFGKLKFKKGSIFKNTKKNLEKLNDILVILNRQYVFYIKKTGTVDELEIRIKPNSSCNCSRCLFTQLKWADLLKLQTEDEDFLKQAFSMYQLGFYKKALKLYYNEFKKSKKEENKILSYQLLYIMRWLTHFVFDTTDPEINTIRSECEKFNTLTDFFQFRNSSKLDQEIAKYFYSGELLSGPSSEVKEDLEKIREHYNSQLSASYSNNSNLWNLMCEFFLFEEFVIANGLPITNYSDFQKLCEDYVEGALLSTALNHYQPTRLQELDDEILISILKYGNADQVSRIYNGYVKKSLSYESSNGSFKLLVRNFLSNSELMKQFEEEKNMNGLMFFYKMFWNLTILLTIVNFEDDFISECYQGLLPFILKLPKREKYNLYHFAHFVEKRGRIIGRDRINELFRICVEMKELHNSRLLESFIEVNKKHSWICICNDIDFETFYNNFFEKCEKCGEYHERFAFSGSDLLDPIYRSKLSERIRSKLSEKMHHETYYYSCMFNLIDYREFWNEFLESFRRLKKPEGRMLDFLEGEVSYREFNNLMNLVFKNKIILPKEFIDRMKGMSDYYDWLVDIDNFDYDKFDPLWIIQYTTSYFLKTFFSNLTVRNKVRDYLRQNNQPKLAYYYSQYVE